MLFRLSRVSFWLAAAVAALGLLVPGTHATLLTAVALAASAAAFGFWRSALRSQHRDHAMLSAVPDPVMPSDSLLRDVAATLVREADAAASFEAALHAVARVLRSELGARECTVWALYEVDATHARLGELIEAQPGFHAVARRVRLAGTSLDQAIRTRRAAGQPPEPVVLPVCAGERVVALIEWVRIDVPVSAAALSELLEQAQATLAGRAAPVGIHHVEDNVVQSGRIAPLSPAVGCRMTRTSGMLQAAQALRRTQFDLGPGWLGDGQRLRESGFDDHASQPLGQGQMLGLLNRHLRLSASAESQGSTASGAVPSAEAAAPVSQVLDPAALARLAELDPKGENHLLERVLQAFQTSVARLRPQAEAARRKGDRAGVRLVVHTLKSSSASIGAMHLSQLCAQIETTIRVESGEDLEALLDAFNAALDDVLQATARLLEERA